MNQEKKLLVKSCGRALSSSDVGISLLPIHMLSTYIFMHYAQLASQFRSSRTLHNYLTEIPLGSRYYLYIDIKKHIETVVLDKREMDGFS
jgi:hypothetical protein